MEFADWKEGDVIAVVTCTCGGAENLARTALKNGGHPDWLNLTISKGKSQTKYVLDALKSRYQNASSYQALAEYVEKRGRYVVIIGYKDKTFAWTDIANGTLKDRLDAEILVKEFA